MTPTTTTPPPSASRRHSAAADPQPGDDGAAASAADPSSTPLTTASRRLSPAQLLAVTRERLLWNRRAEKWDTEGSAGLTKVVAAVLERCQPPRDAVAVDLGCGSGQVTIPLAARCRRVLAVDVSPPFIARLEAKAAQAGADNIEALVNSIEALDLAAESVDLVVSNYALHHLRDVDKARLVERAYSWLKPGGRLVVGDMMFGRGSDAADRAIIASKAHSLLSRGPGGWWRLAKNVWRFTLRLGEKPLPAARWESLACAAGFQDVRSERVVAEACVLTAVKPAAPAAREPRLRAVVAFSPGHAVPGD